MMTTALASCSADRVSAETSTHALGEAIASLAARIHAATYELLVLLREFDTRAGWSTGLLSIKSFFTWTRPLQIRSPVNWRLPQTPTRSTECWRWTVERSAFRGNVAPTRL